MAFDLSYYWNLEHGSCRPVDDRADSGAAETAVAVVAAGGDDERAAVADMVSVGAASGSWRLLPETWLVGMLTVD